MSELRDRGFSVISGPTVRRLLRGAWPDVIDLVRETYLLHGAGATVNPPSSFLRFPDRPHSRIIALPASVGGQIGADGLKWISSYPDNIDLGLPRASAVLILNDQLTGRPFACLEGAAISAVRTAASAALAAHVLAADRGTPAAIGVVGCGLIAHHVCEALIASGITPESINFYDARATAAMELGSHWAGRGVVARIAIQTSAEATARASDLIVFATTSATPYFADPEALAHHPLVLHVSLRDLAPELLLSAVNVVDDIDHCLRAQTSPHLAEQLSGSRDFVQANLYDVLSGDYRAPGDRTVVFSPFGLGILDIALAAHVYAQAVTVGATSTISDFFADSYTPPTLELPKAEAGRQ